MVPSEDLLLVARWPHASTRTPSATARCAPSATPRWHSAPSRRSSRRTSTNRSTTSTTPPTRCATSGRSATTARSRSRRASTPPSSTRATSSGRRSSGSAHPTRDGRAPSVRIVFSGDLGRTDTPIIRDPTVVTDADYVLIESTYGGREHEPQEEAVRILAETVRLVAENDGVLLVPSFAIGRTQEVVWELDRLLSEGKIPELPLYLDSPMASKASDVYRHHADYFDDGDAQAARGEREPARLSRSSTSRTTSATARRSPARRGRT